MKSQDNSWSKKFRGGTIPDEVFTHSEDTRDMRDPTEIGLKLLEAGAFFHVSLAQAYDVLYP